MQLAIPVCDDRISPVFDSAGQLLLVEIKNGSERNRRWEAIAEPVPARRARRLDELGVNVLVCGAISRPLAVLLEISGVAIIPWRAGPVEAVLDAYLKGRLLEPRWRMPGCAGSRKRRRRSFARFGAGPGGISADPGPSGIGRKKR